MFSTNSHFSVVKARLLQDCGGPPLVYVAFKVGKNPETIGEAEGPTIMEAVHAAFAKGLLEKSDDIPFPGYSPTIDFTEMVVNAATYFEALMDARSQQPERAGWTRQNVGFEKAVCV
jgi:hypothetical protein